MRWRALVAGLLIGCTSGPHPLAIDLSTDLVPGVEFDEVVVATGEAPLPPRVAARDEDYVEGVRVGEPSVEAGDARVRVELRSRGEPVLARTLLVRVEAPTRVTMVMTRDCRGVVCPSEGGEGESACLGGRCVDATCTPETPEACPTPECEADPECDSELACAKAACLGGVCVPVDAGTCLAPLYCDLEGVEGEAGACALPAPDCERWLPWSTPVWLEELSSPGVDYGGWISGDGLRIYWGSDRGTAGDEDLYMASRASRQDPFSNITPIDALNGPGNQTDPALSTDETELYFHTNTTPTYDLRLARRTSLGASWSAPVTPPVSSDAANDLNPSPSADGAELVFSRNSGTSLDLFLARRASPTEDYADAVRLDAVSTDDMECCASLDPDGQTLYVEATDSGGRLAIFAATRAGAGLPFEGRAVVAELASATGDGDPHVSADGTLMVLASEREGGSWDLFLSERTCAARIDRRR